MNIKSEFNRNVLTLMTGTTIAQAIPIAITPILTRVYTPEDFGLYALFISIFSIFSVISTGRYEVAIVLPKEDEDAINILALALIINLFLSLTLIFLALFFTKELSQLIGNEDITIWLYFVPITVFFVGLFNALRYFNIRKKNYQDIASATIIKSVVIAVVQVIIGFIKNGATGLISGQILSQFFANMRLLQNIVRDKSLLSSINRKEISRMAIKYINFPKFSIPTAFANSISSHFSNILFSIFYSVSTLGFYSLVQKILAIPSVVIGTSIGDVYLQEGTKERERIGSAIEIFDQTMKKLITIGLPFFILLFFIVEEIFAYIFGEEWRVAGEYAQIMIPLFFIGFVSSTLSTTYDIFEYLKVELLWHIAVMVGTLSIIIVSNFMEIEFKQMLMILAGYTSVMQLISLYIMRKIASGKRVKYADK